MRTRMCACATCAVWKFDAHHRRPPPSLSRLHSIRHRLWYAGRWESIAKKMGEDDKSREAFAWQIIVVQARGGQRPNAKAVPLQATITYGDQKESTPVVKENQPLWNFWTQMPDRGGAETMLFSLLERDDATGKMSVRGETRLDLTNYRRSGKSFELWQSLCAKAGGTASDPPELHFTVTYCPTTYGQLEDTDCQLCTHLGVSLDCSIM